MVHQSTPELIDAARPCRHAVGRRWFVDETYVKVAGVWRYVYRAVDHHGQVIDILVSARRDGVAARRFFHRVLGEHARAEQVTTDKAKALIGAVEDVLGDVEHGTSVHANNRVESDHARLNARQPTPWWPGASGFGSGGGPAGADPRVAKVVSSGIIDGSRLAVLLACAIVVVGALLSTLVPNIAPDAGHRPAGH